MIPDRPLKETALRVAGIAAVTTVCYVFASLAVHLAGKGYTPLGALIIIILMCAAMAGGYTWGSEDTRTILEDEEA